jgi:hypothetical protein
MSIPAIPAMSVHIGVHVCAHVRVHVGVQDLPTIFRHSFQKGLLCLWREKIVMAEQLFKRIAALNSNKTRPRGLF